MANQSSAWSTQHSTTPFGGRARGRSSAWRRTLAVVGAGLFALLPLAPSALAAQTLSISTPYPSVTVAPGSKVSMDLTIRTTDPGQVALAVSGTPTDWTATLHGGGFIVNSVQTDVQPPQANTTAQGPSATARLDVTVPAKAAAGSSKLSVTATTAGLTAVLAVEIKIETNAAGELNLTTDVPDRRGPSGVT
ncbi:MAG TPA: hypothetical protein VM347_03910, partial [Nonomuraea sp.]|nr:hypothetical protein [Nonomuraea sp.]